jgi:ABC-type phosphate transport system substrate-binding protein
VPITKKSNGPVVKERQTRPEAAQTVRDFLTWSIAADGGNDPNVLAELHFVPLPSEVRSIAQRQIGSISGP